MRIGGVGSRPILDASSVPEDDIKPTVPLLMLVRVMLMVLVLTLAHIFTVRYLMRYVSFHPNIIFFFPS